jgi:hypothetical protein
MKRQTKPIPDQLTRVFDAAEIDWLLLEVRDMAEQAKAYSPPKKQRKLRH